MVQRFDGIVESIQNLVYELNEDGNSYCMTGLGENWDWGEESIVISSIFDQKPVTRIGAYAIPSFEWIKRISIPRTINEIHPDAFFNGSEYFKEIFVEKANPFYHSSNNCLIKTESKELIAGCGTSIIPADGCVTSIGENSFQYCDDIQTMYFPMSITDIKDGSFHKCSNLETIVLNENLRHIGRWAFLGCEKLKAVIFNGTESDWRKILIEEGNDCLMAATKTFVRDVAPKDISNCCFGVIFSFMRQMGFPEECIEAYMQDGSAYLYDGFHREKITAITHPEIKATIDDLYGEVYAVMLDHFENTYCYLLWNSNTKPNQLTPLTNDNRFGKTSLVRCAFDKSVDEYFYIGVMTNNGGVWAIPNNIASMKCYKYSFDSFRSLD